MFKTGFYEETEQLFIIFCCKNVFVHLVGSQGLYLFHQEPFNCSGLTCNCIIRCGIEIHINWSNQSVQSWKMLKSWLYNYKSGLCVESCLLDIQLRMQFLFRVLLSFCVDIFNDCVLRSSLLYQLFDTVLDGFLSRRSKAFINKF